MSINCLMLCGMPGAGKTTLGERLLKVVAGSCHVEASSVVRDCYAKLGGEASFVDFVRASIGADPFFFSDKLVAVIRQSMAEFQLAILTGLRRPVEVERLRSSFSRSGVAFLECSGEVRRSRKPGTERLTGMSFDERDQLEMSWGTADIARLADVVVDTSRPIEDSEEQLLSFLVGV